MHLFRDQQIGDQIPPDILFTDIFNVIGVSRVFCQVSILAKYISYNYFNTYHKVN